MLVVLLSWLSVYMVLKAAGHLTSKAFPHFTFNWFEELLLGFYLLSALSIVLSIFIPVNAWVQIVLLTTAIAYLFSQRNSFLPVKWQPGHIFILLIVLILALPVPNHGDSSFYHAQALKWIEHYPAIPGLGNFFSRIAFNSSFFNVQALFSFYPFSAISSRFLNSFLVLIWLLYLYQNATDKNNSHTKRLFTVFYAFITLLIIRGWTSSIAPDVAVGLFMLIITYYLASVLLFGKQVHLSFFLILIFTAITIKLSAVFILPLLLFYPGILKKIHWKHLLIPVFIMTPWLIRSVLLSGYLIYPYIPMIGWVPDWLIPSDVAMIERNWIASWARIPSEPWQQVLQMSMKEWVPVWFNAQTAFNQFIVILCLIGLMVNLYDLLKHYFRGLPVSALLYLLNLWGLILLLWFASAPDFRFGYGLILPYLITVLFHYGGNVWMNNKVLVKTGLLAFPIALVLLTTYVLTKEKTPVLNLLIIPQPYPAVPLMERTIGPIKINTVPLDESCWDSPLPCINEELFPQHIELRGRTIEEGFRPVKEK